MAYDEQLAERMRELLVGERDLTETKMFGGLAFLVRGHMVVSASGRGGALVRCDPARTDALVARGGAAPMVMRGRPMDGWLFVDVEHLRTKRQLSRWVDEALAYVRTLPLKAPKARKRR